MARRAEAVGGGLVGLAAVQFGIVVVLGKLLLGAGMSVVALLVFRYAIAAVLLVPVLVVLRRPVVAVPGERLWLVVLGAVGYSAESGMFFLALTHGTAAAVTLLFFSYPVYVALAAWALGRGRPKRLLLASLASGVAGAVIVVASSGRFEIEPLGVVFVVLSGMAYTAYLIAVEHYVRRTNPLTAAMWVSASVAAGLLAAGLATGAMELPARAADWASLTGIGLASAGAFVCLLAGLQRIGPVRTSIIAAAEPLAATFLAYTFLGERIGLGTAVGGFLIVIGAITASLARPAPPAEEPPLP